MTTTLYYFTGTGNSLWLAKQMQEHIPDCEIESIDADFSHSYSCSEDDAVFGNDLC